MAAVRINGSFARVAIHKLEPNTLPVREIVRAYVAFSYAPVLSDSLDTLGNILSGERL
jgi:hypothetical protein